MRGTSAAGMSIVSVAALSSAGVTRKIKSSFFIVELAIMELISK
jgi:hypothetical protein